MSLTDDDKVWISGELGTKLERFEERLEAKIERVETSLLTEFHKRASPMKMRVKSHSAVRRVLDVELEAIADRVKSLENPGAQNQTN